MKADRSIYIGTSGWHYRHWKGPFYPEGLSSGRMLEFYGKRFRTAEINNTFYQLPEKQTFVQWRGAVPEGFVFAVKASRYITHLKKLKAPETSLSTFLERTEALGDGLGPILFQLPPRWHCNLERLRSFLQGLPEGFKYAFEFRDPSWFGDQTAEALAEKGAAFCIYDFAGRRSPRTVTADFVYIRLHGPEGAYQGQYRDEALSGWAEAVSGWAGQGKDVYCYFDNDEAGYAVHDALKLKSMVKG